MINNVDGVTLELVRIDPAQGPSYYRVKDGGISLDQVAAALAGAGLTGGGGAALAVNPDNVTLEIALDAIQVKDGGLTAAKAQTAAPATQLLSATAAAGTASQLARADHVHQFSDYATENFTGTGVGFSGTASDTVRVTRIGRLVILTLLASIQGTSNATTFTVTGLPAAYWPATDQYNVARIRDNGNIAFGVFRVMTTGVIELAPNALATYNASGWTSSGSKGWVTGSYFYTLT